MILQPLTVTHRYWVHSRTYANLGSSFPVQDDVFDMYVYKGPEEIPERVRKTYEEWYGKSHVRTDIIEISKSPILLPRSG
jgi:hypothetical protein